MRKLFLCLANSKKYGKRCIAGVEIIPKEAGGFKVVKENGKPKWIRPVTTLEHGEVPDYLVMDMDLMDVFEIEVGESCPNGYQSENVKFVEDSLKKVTSISSCCKNLEHLVERYDNTLFTNLEDTINPSEITEVKRSLIMIHAQNATVYHQMRYDREKVRIKFQHAGHPYDLPITDSDFLRKYWKNKNIIAEAKCVYIVVSVGMEHEGLYYKLAAGIICVNDNN